MSVPVGGIKPLGLLSHGRAIRSFVRLPERYGTQRAGPRIQLNVGLDGGRLGQAISGANGPQRQSSLLPVTRAGLGRTQVKQIEAGIIPPVVSAVPPPPGIHEIAIYGSAERPVIVWGEQKIQ
jgi:hypothetical protein